MESLEYIVLASFVVAVFIVIGVEFVSFIIRRAAKISGVGRGVIRDLGAFARILEFILIVVAIVQISGQNSLFTTLTISGIGVLALSLALQTTLSNIISGILLLSDGAIHMGDVIEYGGVKGRVVRIALRNTWIKTESGSIAVVSNTSLSNGPLINHTAVDRLSKKYAIG
jgi:small conductance mechanosensitive channel